MARAGPDGPTDTGLQRAKGRDSLLSAILGGLWKLEVDSGERELARVRGWQKRRRIEREHA